MTIGREQMNVTPTQDLCVLRTRDDDTKLARIPPCVPLQVSDVNQDVAQRNPTFTPSSVVGENEPLSQVNLPATARPEDARMLSSEDPAPRTHDERLQDTGHANMTDTNYFRMGADDAVDPRWAYSAVLGGDSAALNTTRPAVQPSITIVPKRPPKADTSNAYSPNIVLFGESGVGKSSIINLIAGEKRAHISNDALGCTFQYKRHTVTLNGTSHALWDTTGLDEGSEGKVPAKVAEGNLRGLIQGLARSGGIHLVVYCVRSTRLTAALKRNYDLFYGTVCRKKVPVALVVTGLEHQRGDMDTWWDDNVVVLQRHGMEFTAHECVTTLDIDDPVIQWRRSDSQKRLRDLVTWCATLPPWKIEESSISHLLSMFRSHLTGGETSIIRRVIVCDGTTSSRPRTHRRLIGDRQLEYELVHINTAIMSSAPYRLASVLVFYATTPFGARISPEDVDTLCTFYDMASRKTCPVIVVLRGCHDANVARRCWNVVASRYNIPAYPTADVPAEVDAMIEQLCIEHEVKISRLWRAYTAIVQLMVTGWEGLLGRQWLSWFRLE